MKVKLKEVGSKVASLIHELAISSPRTIAGEVQDMPRLFENEALRHYPSVLRVRTGFLRGSTAGLAEPQGGGNWRTGLRNKMNYASFLEDGTKHIQPRKFLETPILTVASKKLGDLLKRIGW